MSTDPLTTLIEAMTGDQLHTLAVRLAPMLAPMIQSDATEIPPARTSPFATVDDAATYLNLTRRSVEALLATGKLTPVKIGMPEKTPRDRWRSWPTRIEWTELEAFARGEPTGSLGANAQRARALSNGHAA